MLAPLYKNVAHMQALGDCAPASLALRLAALADGAEQASERLHRRERHIGAARVHVKARSQQRLQAGHRPRSKCGAQLQARHESRCARLSRRAKEEKGFVLRAAAGALQVLRGSTSTLAADGWVVSARQISNPATPQ